MGKQKNKKANMENINISNIFRDNSLNDQVSPSSHDFDFIYLKNEMDNPYPIQNQNINFFFQEEKNSTEEIEEEISINHEENFLLQRKTQRSQDTTDTLFFLETKSPKEFDFQPKKFEIENEIFESPRTFLEE